MPAALACLDSGRPNPAPTRVARYDFQFRGIVDANAQENNFAGDRPRRAARCRRPGPGPDRRAGRNGGDRAKARAVAATGAHRDLGLRQGCAPAAAHHRRAGPERPGAQRAVRGVAEQHHRCHRGDPRRRHDQPGTHLGADRGHVRGRRVHRQGARRHLRRGGPGARRGAARSAGLPVRQEHRGRRREPDHPQAFRRADGRGEGRHRQRGLLADARQPRHPGDRHRGGRPGPAQRQHHAAARGA